MGPRACGPRALGLGGYLGTSVATDPGFFLESYPSGKGFIKSTLNPSFPCRGG